MASASAVDATAERAYWEIVLACLVQLHGWSDGQAVQAVADFRKRLRALANPTAAVMVYHAEPFDVACDLANRALDYFERRAAYATILAQQHGRSPHVARAIPSPMTGASMCAARSEGCVECEAVMACSLESPGHRPAVRSLTEARGAVNVIQAALCLPVGDIESTL